MDLKFEEIINDMKIKYYDGFDYHNVKNHSLDGSDGMMIIFVRDWKDVLKSLKRNKTLNEIFQTNTDIDLENPIPLNTWVAVYQYGNIGYDLLFDIIRKKFRKINSSTFEWNCRN